ncbi:MAG: amidohydrolase family protein [Gemmatimonadales bacterium]|nr:MAG: amidohydrolase family protein [Gemmatimonadales bacterium]
MAGLTRSVALGLLVASCAPAEEPPVPETRDEPVSRGPLAFENVTVIDAVRGPRAGQTVVVDGDRITAADAGAAIPQDARVIDGTGRYLIPGLWDMHVHLTYDPAFTEAMPGLFLSYGVTSVRDTGGLLEEILPVVEAMRADGAVAPRVFFSGPLLDGQTVVYDGNGRPEIGTRNATPEAARAQVAALSDAGVDFIKVYEMVSPQVFDALVTAGRERDLPIAAHVPLSMRASQVAPRVNSLEHLRNVETDCTADAQTLLERRREILNDNGEASGADLRSRLHRLQRLRAVNTYDPARCREVLAAMDGTIQVPTLRLNALRLQPPFSQEGWMDALDRAPPEVAEPWRAATVEARSAPSGADNTFGEWSLFLVGRMHAAGVPVGAGTDTPIGYAMPGYSLHDELALLVRAGLPPLEALRSATLRPAEFFGLAGEMGRIAEGYRADLVLLSADPLADIQNTRAIDAVVSKGRIFSPEELVGGGG